MRLTDKQFKTLSVFEEHFRTAVKARWARFPSTFGLHTINNIRTEVMGKASRLNSSCSSCVLRLLTEMGNIYFADKAERLDNKRVQMEEKEMPVLEKVEVKTEKKRVRKTKTE